MPILAMLTKVTKKYSQKEGSLQLLLPFYNFSAFLGFSQNQLSKFNN
jgi:hypothetical protein